MRALAYTLLLGLAASGAGLDVRAQAPPAALELPWSARAPRVEGEVVRVAAVASADARIGRFAPRRASARSTARARALAALHLWVDEGLAPLRVDPRVAQAAHDALEAHARVEGVRPLVDGGAVVVVAVPLSALREACPREGAPWM